MKIYNRVGIIISIFFICIAAVLYNQKKEKIQDHIDKLESLKKSVKEKKLNFISNREFEISKLTNEKEHVKKLLDNRTLIKKLMFEEEENVGNYLRDVLYKTNIMFKNVSEPELREITNHYFYKQIIYLDADIYYTEQLIDFFDTIKEKDKFISENNVIILIDDNKSQIGIEYYKYKDLDNLEMVLSLIEKEIEKLNKEVEYVKNK